MKKFVSLLCMLTCVFGLTACASTEGTYLNADQTEAALLILVGAGIAIVVMVVAKLLFGASSGAAKKSSKNEGIDNALAQITIQETNDLELIAVISAAIAASQGANSTNGFVVRSIRKVNRK